MLVVTKFGQRKQDLQSDVVLFDVMDVFSFIEKPFENREKQKNATNEPMMVCMERLLTLITCQGS